VCVGKAKRHCMVPLCFCNHYSLELDLEVKTFFHTSCANLYTRTVRDTCPLEIRVYTTVAARVVFGRTNRVAVLTNNFRTFFAEWTDFCHRILRNRVNLQRLGLEYLKSQFLDTNIIFMLTQLFYGIHSTLLVDSIL
jgi:hypothetical protein